MDWKIYIVAHKEIYREFLEQDASFDKQHYEILNVGAEDYVKNPLELPETDQKKFPTFVELGKWWAESEGIYNLWRSGYYADNDYIGFIHYDYQLKPVGKGTWSKRRVTDRIKKMLRKNRNADMHISFSTFDVQNDYDQKILADHDKPEVLQGDGLNCYDYILKDYNEFFKTDYTIDDLFKREHINLCSCFLIDKHHYDEMMRFFDWVIGKKELQRLDTKHRYRLQGGLAERYFGVYLSFAYDGFEELSLFHDYQTDLKKPDHSKYCVIDRDDNRVGLMSFFNTSLGAIDYFSRRGFEVRVKDQPMHQWNAFFETGSLDDLAGKEPKIVTDLVAFRPDDDMELLTDPLFVDYWHRVYIKHACLNEAIRREFEEYKSVNFGNALDTAIGVLCRGTDYLTLKPIGHPRQPEPADLFPEIDKRLEREEEIFLVTEDSSVYDAFKEKYGNRVLVSEQKRRKLTDKVFLSELVNSEKEDVFIRDKEYLRAIYLLSGCKKLVAGRTSGTVATMIMSEGFEDVFLWNSGRYGDALEEEMKYIT